MYELGPYQQKTGFYFNTRCHSYGDSCLVNERRGTGTATKHLVLPFPHYRGNQRSLGIHQSHASNVRACVLELFQLNQAKILIK